MAREGKLLHHPSADQVLLNNSLEHIGCGAAIPDALGVDHRDRTAFADAEAVGLSAIDAIKQAQLGEPALEILPRLDARFFRAALGLGLIRAEEDMAFNCGEAEAGGDFGEAFAIGRVHPPTTATVFTRSPISGTRIV